MLTGGRVLNHLAELIDDPAMTLLFVGYQGQGTLGAHIQGGARTVRLEGAEREVRCRVVVGGTLRESKGVNLPDTQLSVSAVDPENRRAFWETLFDLVAEGATILVSTHYMDEAERCHVVNYLAYGKLVVSGTVDEVIRHAGLTTYVVDNLAPGTYEFVATAINSSGVESRYSNPATKVLQ